MAQIAKVRCNFWYEHKIYKFINRTFAKENLHWYNLSIKGGFAMNNILFEQFGGTYTKHGDYILPNLTLLAKEETSYIRVWGQRRLTYLKHHRKVLYYNLFTSGKLHVHLADTEKQANNSFLSWEKNSPKKKMLPKNSKQPI